MKNLLIALLMLLSMVSMAAAESKSFTISCTIPAIPGVNAPPYIEEKTVQNTAEINAAAQQAKNVNVDEAQSEPLPMVQKEEISQIQLANAEAKTITVQTFYSR